jgi:glycosyltransferase involved in cell wall biosynthesis
MTTTNVRESKAFKEIGPTAVHFQSQYQESMIRSVYESWGCREFRVIRGAFEPLPFNPRPHLPREPFVVGRLARATDKTKWNPYIWNIFGDVRSSGVDLGALCMGWSPEIEPHCGKPPKWATYLEQDAISSVEFLSRCHALFCSNWSPNLTENWPRVGLEAMSAGVPILADDSGGWREQIVHGETGLLCGSHREFIDGLTRLAVEEDYRSAMISNARSHLVNLVDGPQIADAWAEWLAHL